MKKPAAKLVSINLRLPPDLHKKIVKLAAQETPPMSMNSAIVAMLTHGVERREGLKERGFVVKLRPAAPGEVEREIAEARAELDKTLAERQRENKEALERLQSAIAELVLRIEKVESKK